MLKLHRQRQGLVSVFPALCDLIRVYSVQPLSHNNCCSRAGDHLSVTSRDITCCSRPAIIPTHSTKIIAQSAHACMHACMHARSGPAAQSRKLLRIQGTVNRSLFIITPTGRAGMDCTPHSTMQRCTAPLSYACKHVCVLASLTEVRVLAQQVSHRGLHICNSAPHTARPRVHVHASTRQKSLLLEHAHQHYCVSL